MMTAEQKLKWKILSLDAKWKKLDAPEYPNSNIEELYQDLIDDDYHWDAESETREGEYETNIQPEYLGDFESKSVAIKLPDNTYVGWTYFDGGGKHSNPDEIKWIENAYDLDCIEEEKTIISRTFTKK